MTNKKTVLYVKKKMDILPQANKMILFLTDRKDRLTTKSQFKYNNNDLYLMLLTIYLLCINYIIAVFTPFFYC
jgi:hypothetical protein